MVIIGNFPCEVFTGEDDEDFSNQIDEMERDADFQGEEAEVETEEPEQVSPYFTKFLTPRKLNWMEKVKNSKMMNMILKMNKENNN